MTPESVTLWQEKLQLLLSMFREHVAVEQLAKLLDEARACPDTPTAVLNILGTLFVLRMEIDQL